MTKRVKSIGVAIALIITVAFLGSRGCEKSESGDKPEKTATATEQKTDQTTVSLQKLQEQITKATKLSDELQKQLADTKKFWGNNVNGSPAATKTPQETENISTEKNYIIEKKQEIQDKIEFWEDEIDSIKQTLLNYESSLRDAQFRDPADKAWGRRLIKTWEKKLAEAQKSLKEAKAK